MRRELAKSELKVVSGGMDLSNPQQACASAGMVVGSVTYSLPANTTALAAQGTIGVTLGVNGTVTNTVPTNIATSVTCVPPPPPVNCSNSAPVKTSDASEYTTGEGQIAGEPVNDPNLTKQDVDTTSAAC
jgi:hypothetical protein